MTSHISLLSRARIGDKPAQRARLSRRTLLIALIAAASILVVVVTVRHISAPAPTLAFASGNGRLEATQVSIAPRLAGRIASVLVHEGDYIHAGQVLAIMDTRELEAQLAGARARQAQADSAKDTAIARQDEQRHAIASAEATLTERQSELGLAATVFSRATDLKDAGSISQEQLDNEAARLAISRASTASSAARVASAKSAMAAARAQGDQAAAEIGAAAAEVLRIETLIEESYLKAPCDGRVVYRVAEPGEVIAGGATVLSLVDMSEVHMTFFVSEEVAGKLELGSEARVVIDADRAHPLVARISYVASVAQFTPKTVETANEREKLMFRVKAQIEPSLVNRYRDRLKLGVPGVAFARLDSHIAWPPELSVE